MDLEHPPTASMRFRANPLAPSDSWRRMPPMGDGLGLLRDLVRKMSPTGTRGMIDLDRSVHPAAQPSSAVGCRGSAIVCCSPEPLGDRLERRPAPNLSHYLYDWLFSFVYIKAHLIKARPHVQIAKGPTRSSQSVMDVAHADWRRVTASIGRTGACVNRSSRHATVSTTAPPWRARGMGAGGAGALVRPAGTKQRPAIRVDPDPVQDPAAARRTGPMDPRDGNGERSTIGPESPPAAGRAARTPWARTPPRGSAPLAALLACSCINT